MFPEQLEYRLVEDSERAKWLRGVAAHVDGWFTPSERWPEWKADRELRNNPDAAIVVTPEGYGKSSLVAHLIAKGFKVVFCAKSNTQLIKKEIEMTCKWRNDPAIQCILGGRRVTVDRYVSKAQHFQAELDLLGIDDFKLPEYDKESPYSIATVNEAEAIKQLAALFADLGLTINAEEFFDEHYLNYRAAPINGAAVDVVMLSFARFQAFCQGKRPWWHSLGLVKSSERVRMEVRGEQRTVLVRRPFEKVAVIIDDPDRADVDWLRRVSVKNAQSLVERRLKETAACGGEELPDTKIVKLGESYFEQRPPEQILGHRFKPAKETSRFRPKMIVTTTERVTAEYALHTLKGSGLKIDTRIEMFRTPVCDVTAIQTMIVRRKNKALLPVMIELLKEEFPESNVTLIGDGLSCEFNLSNNKGQNGLGDRTTVIKLSWPHGSVIATAKAHLKSLNELQHIAEPIPDSEVSDQDDDDVVLHLREIGIEHNELIAILLGDLANQALGRNQGFRYQNKEAILLVDPRWYREIIRQGVLRYELTPWSTHLPSLNKKASLKSVWQVLGFHQDRESPLQKKLIELMLRPDIFGMSADAKRLAQKLPAKQQALFQKWLDDKLMAQPKVEERKAIRRKQNTEAVQRHRARKKAALPLAA